jgi:uncharacterized protein YggE
MKTFGLALWTAALVSIAPAGTARAAEFPPRATLTVTGDGTVTRAPDRAVVSFAVQTNDADSGAATSANAAIAIALTARMLRLGLSVAAVTTSGYGLDYTPRPSKPDPANDQRYGYTVTRSIDVTVDAIDRAGAVVDAGVAAGATNVNGVAFELRDPHAARLAAQSAALADATAQARSLAAAAGVRLVRIISIAPGGDAVAPRLRMAPMALKLAAVPTTIDPGNLTVTAQVTLRYEIAPLK